MAVLQGGGQNLPSQCVCYPKDPLWNRVNNLYAFNVCKKDDLCFQVVHNY